MSLSIGGRKRQCGLVPRRRRWRFRSAGADDLKRHLVGIDALDDRPPLSAAAIVERATDAAVAAHPDVPARDIEAFATWVVAVVAG